MKQIKIVLFLTLFSIPFNLFAPLGISYTKTNYTIKKELAPLFEEIGTWVDKPFGWLLVRDGKTVYGKVLVQLSGASYTNPKIANDYSITYVGYDSNGCYMKLAKGLYAWQDPKDPTNFQTIPIRPAHFNKFSKDKFDYHHNMHEWYQWGHPASSKHKWDPKKERYAHPSKEISDIVR